MREFKFRVWYGNEMIDDVEAVGMDDIGPFFIEDELNPRYYCEAIMQSTGLKDSKGVEVYEGDIVRFYDSPTDDMVVHVGVVEWITGDAVFQLTMASPFARLFRFAVNPEVIGNKFEDLELIPA